MQGAAEVEEEEEVEEVEERGEAPHGEEMRGCERISCVFAARMLELKEFL